MEKANNNLLRAAWSKCILRFPIALLTYPVHGMSNEQSERLRTVFREVFSWHNRAAWMVLLVSITIALLAWTGLRQTQTRAANQQFESLSLEMLEAINKRMLDHELILLSGAALMDANPVVTRAQWAAFVERLRVAQTYPGIQGLGYSQVIAQQALDEFEQSIQAEGFPEFAVRPPGLRDVYTSIVYLEPFRDRNLAAFGYDMFSEPVRREAMLNAARSGDAALTGRVTLVQETHGKVQAGMLMYVPVYRPGAPLDSPEQRWNALRGFVYSPYRVDDLMAGILGSQPPSIDFAIYDGTRPSADSMLHVSSPAVNPGREPQGRHQLQLYGRTWTVDFYHQPGFIAGFWRDQALVVVLGLALSLVLFALVTSLSHRRLEVQRRADRMTIELRRKELSLRLSQERLALALKGSNDGWWDIDLVDRSFYASPRIWQMVGRVDGTAESGQMDWRSLVAMADHAALKNQVIQAGRAEEPYFALECDLLHRNGYPVPVLLRGYIQTDAQGRPLRIGGTCMDLTERREIERIKNELISVVSHELRTPVTSISGALGLISGGALGEIPPAIHSMVDIAHQNSVRLNRLINNLLDMDKLIAGKMAFDIRPQPLGPIIEQALELHRALAEPFGVTLNMEGRIEDWVLADTERLQQVLSNLLSNAIKFSPREAQVRVHSERHGESVRVCISDQGPGVPEGFRDQIFKKFSQADSSSRRQKGGTGLGLVICKELVGHMGGRIGFDSAPGAGAVFWFELKHCEVRRAQPRLPAQDEALE